MNTMKPGWRAFWVLGLPCWILTILLFPFSWFAGTLFTFVQIIAFYFVILHGRKQDRIQQLTKMGLILMVIEVASFIAMVEQPTFWGQQLARSYDLSLLITPEDENVQLLKQEFEGWLATSPNVTYAHYSTYFDNGLLKWEWYSWDWAVYNGLNWSDLDELERSMVIDYYIQTYIVNWTSDTEVYGVADYKATPHEVLAQNLANGWTAPARDDCDGIAVVTVSLLRNYHIAAYIAEGKAHWFTAVRLSNETRTKYGLDDNPIFLNYWSSVHVWSYFDEDEFYLGQQPLLTVMDMIVLEDEEVFAGFYAFVDQYPYLLQILSVPAAIVLVLFIGYPRHYPNEEENLARKIRMEKLGNKWKWTQNRWNPLNWVLYLTYVRTGNPFRKVYRNEWLNFAIYTGLILLPLQLLIASQGHLTMYSLLYLNLYGLFVVWLLHWDVFVKLKDRIMRNKTDLTIPSISKDITTQK